MRPSKSLLTVAATIAAIFVLPSTASAANYCVGVSASCTNSPAAPFSADAAGITAAINAAYFAPGSDVVFIAAGTYAISETTFPAIVSSADSISIVGAGVGQTILNGSAPAAPLVGLQLPTSFSTFSGFTLNVAFTSSFSSGIAVLRGQINNFEVNQTGNVNPGAPAYAIDLKGNTAATDGVVNSTDDATGIGLTSGGTIVRRVTLNGQGAGAGIYVDGTADTSMSNLRILGYALGVRIGNGTVELTDSLIDMQAADNAIGLYAEDQNTGINTAIDILAARNTIVGSGESTGALINVQEATDTSDSDFRDMLIYGSDANFDAVTCAGAAGSTTLLSASGLASTEAPILGGDCNYTPSSPSPVVLGGSPFVNFATGDYRPTWNSVLVDAGGSTNQAGGNDIAGDERIVDGDGDGVPTVDTGAFEYQAAPPTGAISGPATAVTGQSVTFTHTMTDPDPTNSIAGVVWNFGDGSSSTLPSPSHTFATAGIFTVTVGATNQAGTVGTASFVISVTSPALALVPTAKVTVKPKNAFKRGSKGVTLVRRGAPSFSVAFADATKAKFTLQSLSKRKKWKSLRGSQTLTLPVTASPVKFSFGGKWNRKKLAPGVYRLKIAPLAADGTAGTPVTVTLKLKK